ncbi:nitrous oxide reductase accessory protein NosL [Arcobacter sp. KX21116]|uniref:nitrous oxide reductase accessory protein NosL n=1 Tax=Arcobacter iocasae TaxID=2906515 RepID=UPI0035D4A82A
MFSKLLFVCLFNCLIMTYTLNASENTMNFNKETKGLVRKILVYKNPSWVSKIITNESKEFYFVSPKSMFDFYFDSEKWSAANIKDKNQIKELVVTNYANLRPIDAKKAYYVYGANKISSAGDDLPAFELYSQAKKFAKENNGKRILKFNEITKGLIELLNGDI